MGMEGNGMAELVIHDDACACTRLHRVLSLLCRPLLKRRGSLRISVF